MGASASPKPNTYVYDLGYVETDSIHHRLLLVPNPGNSPMNISKIQSDCSCTKVVNPPPFLAVGTDTSVEVVFHAPDIPVAYARNIHLLPAKSTDPSVILLIKARVGIPLQILPASIDLPALQPGVKQETPLVVHNHGKSPVHLLYSTSSVPGCLLTVPRLAVPPQGQVSLTLNANPDKIPASTHEALIQLHTDSTVQPTLQLQVRWPARAPN